MVGQNHSKAGTGYVNSGSGLRILEYWAQILEAYFIIIVQLLCIGPCRVDQKSGPGFFGLCDYVLRAQH